MSHLVCLQAFTKSLNGPEFHGRAILGIFHPSINNEYPLDEFEVILIKSPKRLNTGCLGATVQNDARS